MNVFIVVCVILMLVGFLVALFPPLISFLAYCLSLFIIFILLVICIVFILLYRKDKKSLLKLIIIGFLLVVYLWKSYPVYNYIHSRNEVKKSMQTKFGNYYKVLGLSQKRVAAENITCDYVFDVKVNDTMNVTFQAAYCDTGIIATDFTVVNNYFDHCLPIYLKQYNELANKNLVFSSDVSHFLNDEAVFHYSTEEEKQEIREFINYLKTRAESNNSLKVHDDIKNIDHYISLSDENILAD